MILILTWFNPTNGTPSGVGWVGKQALEMAPVDWYNSVPLTLAEFWTDGCYNCRNTLPYVKVWHRELPSDLFKVIGVDAPEFEIEKSASSLSHILPVFVS